MRLFIWKWDDDQWDYNTDGLFNISALDFYFNKRYYSIDGVKIGIQGKILVNAIRANKAVEL